ncbi:ATP-binding protein [Gloeocapsa sp. PCC 73106]|uniref:hybrid sensor histidine kinase/response regulator n=1 Tax=Gloeocapsa sp. PCC 73106 TaxID=102232 RepID=UPI0002AD1A79|nr:ATP-binding protein [Gloeocapsa sp. PCC 73106]ELR97494.1 histidine kinase,Response regulator receiver domain protein,histidine kinase [Gloeocapsa sp. PCC 73106]
MSSSFLSLQDFLDPVQEMARNVNLDHQIKIIFRLGVNKAIVVDEGRYPLGVVYARSILAKYLENQAIMPNQAQLDSLVEPITILPAAMSLVDYYREFSHSQLESKCCVLVDNGKKLLGVLNQANLLKAIALHKLPEQNLLALLEKLPLPVMLKTSQGRILAQNHQWRQQIGDFVPTDEIINTDTVLATLCLIPTSVSNLQTYRHLPQNAPSPWEFSKVPLDRLDLVPADSEAEKLVWLILANDLSQQQELYSQLASKQIDLVELNRIKDEFLSGITHDLKSPLTAIIGLSTLLKEKKLGELNPRQSRYVDLIYQSGRQMMTLVNDLLDLNRLETGQLKLSPEAINLQSICKLAYEQIKDKLKQEKLVFSLEIETSLNTITADPLRLGQMLAHLLENAIKFTPTGGKIGLKVNTWQNWLALTVWDTGMGIPETSQQMVLQKCQSTGRGLGLVLTKRLAQIHGGDISFLSIEAKGSRFTILLPLDPNQVNLQVNPIVLLVEVIPGYIEELNESVESLNYRVVIARTGTEALEKARQLKPHCILLNPCLPFLSGWDLLILLKSDPETQKIPVILTTTPSEEVKEIAKQADGVLTLPVDLEVLASILQTSQPKKQKKLTILYLYPGSEISQVSDHQLEWLLHTRTSGLIKRILEADSLEQAELLAKVWEVDAIVLNGSHLSNPAKELSVLIEYEGLAELPLITLDDQTTKAANQIPGLQVYPCLVNPETQNVEYLLQVIEIAVNLTSSP